MWINNNLNELCVTIKYQWWICAHLICFGLLGRMRAGVDTTRGGGGQLLLLHLWADWHGDSRGQEMLN